MSLILVAKLGGDIYIYQDYRDLNNIIIKNRYSLLLIRETLDIFCYIKIYIKLDIVIMFNKLYIIEDHK